MKNHFFRLIVISILVVSPITSTFAGGVMAEPAKIATPDSMPIYNPKKFYKFNKVTATTLFKNKTSSLQQITCPSDVLMRQVGLIGTNRKWTNVTYEDVDSKMYITYDMINCNFNGYNANNTDFATLKPISLEYGLETAKKFISASFIKDVVGNMLGEPVIVNQYNYSNPMPIEPRGEKTSSQSVMPDYIDKDEYTNVTVLFPYVIDGKKVYSNYGGRLGVTVEVTEKGINSYYGQLLALPGVTKDAKPMTDTQFISYIKRGGNNPYRGNKSTVTLGAPERIYTLVNDWRNGKSATYIASATLFPSTMMIDDYSSQLYEMVITDYKFANGNMMSYPTPMY